MKDAYITVRQAAHDEVVIQKSRFIGYASPCFSEEEAQKFLLSLREKHRDARHHCYAYIIGQNSGIMRYSDDGEPGGTAGMPMMDVLRNEHVVNCCVVVVRYFGGILLGTGGLVRAYTQGCKIALQAAGLVRMECSSVKRFRVSYSLWNQIQYSLGKMPVRISNVQYQDMVEFDLCARTSDMGQCLETLMNVTDGAVSSEDLGEQYIPWDL